MLGELVAGPRSREEAALVLVTLRLDHVGALELRRHEPHSASTALREVKASANRVGRNGLHPAQAHQPEERLAVEPVLAGLGREVLLEQRQLPLHDLRRERHEHVRPPEVAVELRDLVLEDQVVAEGVPRQLAGESVILVEVVTGVGEDELRIDAPLQILEHLLDLAADVGQEAVSELVHLDASRGGSREERLRARPCLRRALPGGREHHPVDLELRIRRDEREEGSSAPDLDVVRVAADREDAAERLSR